LRLATL